MDMVDSIKIHDGSRERYISFWEGDLAEIPVNNPVDLIIVSAFRNSYTPTPSSIIGALHRKGLSVQKLAENKAIDLRDTSGFWICLAHCWRKVRLWACAGFTASSLNFLEGNRTKLLAICSGAYSHFFQILVTQPWP